MHVIIRFYDRDQHDLDCDCGLCSQVNHVSWGYAVFLAGSEDPLDVFYAPSEQAAGYNAHQWAKDNDFIEATHDELPKLWAALSETPIDDSDQITAPFQAFPVGTDRFEIWHWFEETFDISIEELWSTP